MDCLNDSKAFITCRGRAVRTDGARALRRMRPCRYVAHTCRMWARGHGQHTTRTMTVQATTKAMVVGKMAWSICSNSSNRTPGSSK